MDKNYSTIGPKISLYNNNYASIPSKLKKKKNQIAP